MSAAPLRVLIVDDNRDAVAMLRILLELSNYEVSTAFEGEEALAIAERERPDVVLLDIGLPDLDGYEVCRRLRAQPWGRRMLIAAQTGWNQESDRRRSLEAGFDVHLIKPVETSTICDLLAKYQQTGRKPEPAG